jgi:exopolysaccharide production protein ExoQ
MPPPVATIVFTFGILGLFVLARDRTAQTSKALWLPVVWLLINGSRQVSLWLRTGPRMSSLSDTGVDGSPLDAAIFGTILVAGLIVLIGRRRQVKAVLRANLPIVMFFAYCAISIVWSDYPFVSFKRWFKAVGDIVMVLVVLTDPGTSDAVKRLLARVSFILVPISVLLIKYYPDMSVYYDAYTGRRLISGVAMDKNMLGMGCLVFGLGAWWQCLEALEDLKGKERIRRLIAYGTVLAMAIWLFHEADSMSSLSNFIMGSALIAMSRFRPGRKTAVVNLVVLALVGLSFSALFLQVGGGAIQAMGRNPTLTGRTEIWSGLLQMNTNPLLGAGFESFWLHNKEIWAKGGYLDGVNEAHNGYLEVFLNLGWIGVTLLAVLILTGYRNVVIALRQEPEAGGFRLALFVVAIVYSFTEAGFRPLSLTWIALLLAIMVVPKSPKLNVPVSTEGQNADVSAIESRPARAWVS